MKQYRAEIDVMPLKEILDPQGKAVRISMKNLELTAVTDVRIGKHISMLITAANEAGAREIAETACRKMLANPVMEYFELKISEE